MARSRSASRKNESKEEAKSPSSKSPSRKKSPARELVKTTPKAKSPVRSKSPGRPKSPARSKSPARPKSTGKSKSPARSKKSPTRVPKASPPREPSPKAKSKSKTKSPERTVTKKTTRVTASNEVDTESSSDDTEQIIRSRVARFEDKINDYVIGRRSTRRGVVENNVEKETNNYEKSHKPEHKSNLWMTIAALLLLVAMPIGGFYMSQACTKESCRGSIPKINLNNLGKYFDLEVFAWYMLFFLGQVILTIIPFPKADTGHSYAYKNLPSFHCNGIVSVLLMIIGIGVAKYLKYPLTPLIEKYPLLLVPSFVAGTLISLIVFFTTKDHKDPESNGLIEFVFGRHVSPMLAGLNFKMLLINLFFISNMIYLVVLIIAEAERTANYKTLLIQPLVLLSFLQLFYSFDFLVFMPYFLTSYTMQNEKVGFWASVGSTCGPFIFLAGPNYLYYNRLSHSIYVIAACWAVFIAGYLIYRFSNYQKGVFRRNPHQFSSGSGVIVSREGGLLCSGLWSIVRHPNYVGALLISWSLLALSPAYWAAYVFPAAMTVEHFIKINLAEKHCQDKHTSAWSTYTSKVPYKLVPHIY